MNRHRGLLSTDNLMIVLLFALCGVIVFGGILFDRAQCYAKWEDGGRGVRWSLIGGCRVQMDNGTWIPSDRYRAIED